MSVLTDTLMNEHHITIDQLKEAQVKQVGAKQPIQEILVDMDFINEKDLLDISAKIYKMSVTDLDKENIDTSILEFIPYEKVKRYGVFPFAKEKKTLVIAMSNPVDIVALDDIKALTKMELKPVLCSRSQITEKIEQYYNSHEMLYDLLKNAIEDKKVMLIKEGKKIETRYEIQVIKDEYGPVARLINFILSDAIKLRATDIHIEPLEKSVKIRYRIDGGLRDIIAIPRQLLAPLVARIKVMAKLNLAETRKPQDGRNSVSAEDRNIELRISIIPTYNGEKIVIRVLDKQAVVAGLDSIGLTASELALLKGALEKPQGMILVTGPTGSGKTSTLYEILNQIKSETKNIVTLEDPVEYMLDGISQVQINPVKDVTFASGLRSILRQDPDIILVGEIRDKETADIAFKSSLTGHLVFSTLHTNNAVATITRLMDMGLESYLISSSILMIIAQRLVRLVCLNCKEEYEPDKDIVGKISQYVDKYKISRFYKGKGCEECNYTGYSGRTAIFELLEVNNDIRQHIDKKSPEEEIFKEASKGGLRTLAESGVEKVSKGLTTVEEVLKVAGITEDQVCDTKTGKADDKIKILIVDDEERIRIMIESRLINKGYAVIKAENGKEAVEFAVKEKPDLIVMDVMMPEINGYEATRILRSRLETAGIPILMLTAKSDLKSELKGLDMGADDYMSKPFEGERLMARINMLLKRRMH